MTMQNKLLLHLSRTHFKFSTNCLLYSNKNFHTNAVCLGGNTIEPLRPIACPTLTNYTQSQKLVLNNHDRGDLDRKKLPTSEKASLEQLLNIKEQLALHVSLITVLRILAWKTQSLDFSKLKRISKEI